MTRAGGSATHLCTVCTALVVLTEGFTSASRRYKSDPDFLLSFEGRPQKATTIHTYSGAVLLLTEQLHIRRRSSYSPPASLRKRTPTADPCSRCQQTRESSPTKTVQNLIRHIVDCILFTTYAMSATAQADYLEFVATARARGTQMVTQSHKNSARSSLESTVNTFSTGLQNTMRTESRVAGHELFNLPVAEWVGEIGGGAMAWGALNSLND